MLSMRYLEFNILNGKFNESIIQIKLRKLINNKNIQKNQIKNCVNWIYEPSWLHKSCLININQVLEVYQFLSKIRNKNKFDYYWGKLNKNYKNHILRIKKANLKYPILVLEESGTILDGRHRFAKAVFENKNTIEIIYINIRELNNIL